MQKQTNRLTKEKETIEKEVQTLIKTVTRYMEQYRYSDAALTLYEYAWHTLADVHIEKTKQWVSEGHVEAIDCIEKAYKTVLSTPSSVHAVCDGRNLENIWRENTAYCYSVAEIIVSDPRLVECGTEGVADDSSLM